MTMSMMEIDQALKQLNLSGVRATLETRLIEAQVSNLPFVETFSAILQDEIDRRQSRLLERRFQLSGLDERTSLAEFDWSYNPKIPKRTCFELHTLKFIAEGDSASSSDHLSTRHDAHLATSFKLQGYLIDIRCARTQSERGHGRYALHIVMLDDPRRADTSMLCR